MELFKYINLVITVLCVSHVSVSFKMELNLASRHERYMNYTDTTMRKRIVTSNDAILWEKGIVPYVFGDNLPSDKANSYKLYVFPVYEKYSCIRFVPWTSNTQTEYGLSHNNYLRFVVNGARCESYLGNVKSNGQDISGCKWTTCLHEIGHALGFAHEHQNVLRDEFTRFNYQNVAPGSEGNFKLEPTFLNYDMYDLDSLMHYGFKAFSKNTAKTIDLLDEDLRPYSANVDPTAYFYFFYELNERYQCTASCSTSCENGGYVAFVEGACGCRCPEGLDPTRRCRVLLKADYNCGDIITLDDTAPTATIISPTITADHDVTCHWFIKSPENSKIVLDFPEFDVQTTNGECTDEVALRYYMPGSFGAPFCGGFFPKAVQSYDNMIVISYTQSATGSKSSNWKASLSMVRDEDLCYDVSTKGHTYDGQVEHAENYRPCLRWDEVHHCKHNIFNPNDFGSHLEGNSCRNPDGATRPWCYTESEHCQRTYCDACQLVPCRDLFPNCAAEMSSNSAYCSQDPAATRGCRKSCGLCENSTPLAKVSDVTCPKPKLPTDAADMNLKNSYVVGETVTVVCQSDSSVYKTITCLTSGKWTELNFVCGTCADGWLSFRDKCYKLFHNKRKLINTYSDCADAFPGARLFTDTDSEVHDFITSAFKSDSGLCEIAWMGVTKNKNTNTYEWTDGSPTITWENWNTAFPSSKRYPCVLMANDCTWKDKNCGLTNKYICQYTKTSEPVVCKDQRLDCDEVLRTNPDVCERERGSFATVNCPYTCAICGDVSHVKCSDEGWSKNAQLSATVMSPGQHIKYTCNSGFNLVTGNLLRACTLAGELTGSPPQCLGVLKYDWPVNTLEIRERDNIGQAGFTYIANNEYMRIPRKGELMRWSFYSMFDGTVALQVWRKVSSTQYSLVGQNVISNTMEDRQREITIPDDGSRIVVKTGDIIGVFYAGNNPGGIPFDTCSTNYFPAGNQLETSSFKANPAKFNVGSTYSFAQKSGQCRLFSLNALIDSK